MDMDMTFINALKDALADEAADIEKYMGLAEQACEHSEFKKFAPILRDIAKEEQVHHKHIASILHDLGAEEHDHENMIAEKSEIQREDE